MGIVVIIFYVAILVLMIASGWKIYEKAGQPGWAAIVPIYNIVVLCKIIGKPTWWTVLCFIPIVNYVILIMMIHGLSKSFGKGAGYTVGLIFLGIIFYPMLAFGDAQYITDNRTEKDILRDIDSKMADSSETPA